MNLTKPAGAFVQIIGGFFLVIGIFAIAMNSATGFLFLILGVILMYVGGRPARAHLSDSQSKP
jgi:hypothetical protein